MATKEVEKKQLSQDNEETMAMEGKSKVKGLRDKGPQVIIPDRRLGGREAFLHILHEELFGGSSILCVSTRIAGPLDIQLVKHACRHLWERHPLLRARITPKEDGFYFVFDVPFHDIPVHSFFELGKTDVHTLTERETDTLFDASKSLWRVLLITDKTDLDRHYLIFSLHHSISDASCANHLAQEAIEYCAKLLAAESIRVDPLPLRPCLEELIPTITVSEPMTVDAKRPSPSIDERCNAMPFHEYMPAGRRHTRFRSVAVGKAKLEVFSQRCLNKKTTVHAALAAMALAIMERRFGDGARIGIESAVSVRRLGGIHIGDDELGCLEADVRIEYDGISGPGNIWNLAQDYNEDLTGVISGRTRLAAEARHGPEGTIEKLRAARQFSLCCFLTDAGKTVPSQRGPFVTENVNFICGRRCARHIMFISTATVGDVLSITFAYASPLIKDTWADKFISDFIHLMDRMIK